MNMRTNICLAITISVVLSFLVACSPAAPTAVPAKPATAAAPAVAATTAPPAPAPATTAPAAAATKPAAAATVGSPATKIKRGGTLRLAQNYTIPSFDPHLTSAALGVHSVLYDGFLRFDMTQPSPPKFEVTPELVESWQITDPKTINMKMARGVKFHDGSDFNAQVARWNLDRMMTHPKSVMKSALAAIQSVEVVDDFTLKLLLKNPSASILVQIAQPSGFRVGVVSQKAIEQSGDDGFNRKPVGSGPFVFSDWVTDDHATLKRFDGYWRKGADGQALPYLDGYVYRYIADPSVALLELQSGNLEFLENVEAKDVERVKGNQNLALYDLAWAGGSAFPALGLYMQGPVMGKDKRLRQAAFYALDRESMAKALGFGLARPWYYPYWAEGTLGYDPTLPKYDFQLQKAKDLLREAGYPNGIEVTLDTIARQPELRISEVLQSMWNAAGLKTTINAIERLAWIDKVNTAKKFDAAIWGGPMMFDPGFTGLYLKTGAAQNWGSYSNPEVDKLIDQADASYDAKEREQMYKRIQRLVYEDAYISYGYVLPTFKATTSKLMGVKFQWTRVDLNEAWLDK
jgi:peptide/nickel transport system substrate-binding protein